MAFCNKDSLLFYSSDTRCVVFFMAASNDAVTSLILMLLRTVASLKTMKLRTLRYSKRLFLSVYLKPFQLDWTVFSRVMLAEFGITVSKLTNLSQVNRRYRISINTRHHVPLLEPTIRLITPYWAFSASGLVFQQVWAPRLFQWFCRKLLLIPPKSISVDITD